jgi:hypothetical protein
MKLKSWVAIASIAASGIVAGGSFDRVSAATITLYDGSSNVTPDAYNAPNQYLNFGNAGAASQTASGGVTTLNTFNPNPIIAQSSYAGYTNYKSDGSLVNLSFPVLDNNAGYTLSFTIDINAQTNSKSNRAGFSAIVLGSDKKGIEIGFRNSDIFALNADIKTVAGADSLFSLGEHTTTDLSGLLSSPNTYDLTISGSGYTLKNGSTLLLSGLLRDYSPYAIQGTFTQVYDTANFMFLGDDTTSAAAEVDIQNITLNTNTAAVPEPSSLLGTGLAIGFGIALKRRLRKLKIKN